MPKPQGGRKGRILVLLIIIFLLTPSLFYALDAPHTSFTSGYTINCGSCHWVNNSDSPPWMSIPSSPDPADDTINNRRCYACHDGSKPLIPAAKTHSSSTTGSVRWSTMGGWSTECVTCHNPHQQRQTRTWGAPTHLQTGPQPTVGVWDTGDNWTQITVSNTLTDNYYGYYFMPDKNYPFFYKIVSDTTGTTFNVKGDVLETYVKTGGYAIVFGKNVNESINFTNPGGTVKGGTVKLFRPSGDNGPGDTWNSNTTTSVCYVCHTQTRHWSPTGDTTTHNDRTDCTQCHQHVNGFAHGGGTGTGCDKCHGYEPSYQGPIASGGNYSGNGGGGTYKAHSTHTEKDANHLRGPFVSCSTCHNTTSFPDFADGVTYSDYKAGRAMTTVCNACHSPGGTYDGVNHPVIGAKNNWSASLSPDSRIYNADGTLKAGKEKWCAGCHDEMPSVIQGVSAPKVIGDEDGTFNYGTGWGFYKTGHGVPTSETMPASGGATNGPGKGCGDCHDSTMTHIDGVQRSFTYSSGDGSALYQAGYRLKSINGGYPMQIPPSGTTDSYRLCFSCHTNTDQWIGSFSERNGTNFWGGSSNDHYRHLKYYSVTVSGIHPDYDWNGTYDYGLPTCVTCHNVHGSTNPAMIHDGSLNGKPGFVTRYGNGCDNTANTDWAGSKITLPESTILATQKSSFQEHYCSNTCHGTGTGFVTISRTPVNVVNRAPVLNWSGVPGFVSDGVNPNSGASGSTFTFRVKYSDINQDAPTKVQLWIDLNNDGDYNDAGEKIDMQSTVASLDPCTPYSVGVDYITTVTINKSALSGNSIKYRFYAESGADIASGAPTYDSTLQVLNAAPILSWTGEANYTNGGVNPVYGPKDGSYAFRVKYVDDDGDACPAGGSANIQVWIDLNGDLVYDAGEKFNLTEVDPNDHDCTTAGGGKLYYANVSLPNTSGVSRTYNYRFYASDGNSEATGSPVNGGTVTVAGTTNNPPLLSWNTGTCRPQGAMPPKSTTSSTINFSVKYFDESNQCPASGTSAIQVWVDLNNNGVYESGEKFNLTDQTGGSYCDTAHGGKVYSTTVTPTTVGSGIKYEFHASDGTSNALGDPAVKGATVDVIAANAVVKKDGTEDYTTIGAAISGTGSGATILVYDGIYSEYVTYSSRTLVSACGPEETIISSTNNPAVRFYQCQDVTLDGFTVRDSAGDGIYAENTNYTTPNCRPVLNHLIVRNNAGRGINSVYAPATLTNSEIYSNTGGGVKDVPTITGTVIRNNSVTGDGGGINGNVRSLTNVIIKDNTATGNGGGMYINAGSTHPSSTYEKITLSRNTAGGMGGGAYFTYSSPITITNSLVSDNTASTGGGGLAVDIWSSVQFKNSTIVNNTATNGNGGAFASSDGPVNLANSIVWGNRASGIAHIGYFTASTGVKTVDIYDSVIENNGDDNITDDNYFTGTANITVVDHGSNHDEDPNFVDATNADKTKRNYHVQAPSIAIDHAGNTSGQGIPSDDLDGNTRPAGSAADIGAYEYPEPAGYSVPVLSWTGETNYTKDGVNPDIGEGGSSFTFRVHYADAGGATPTIIQLWLDRNDDGIYQLSEKYDLSAAGNGIYTITIASLPGAGDGYLNYRFYASDGFNDAVGDPTNNSMVIVGLPTVTFTSASQSKSESGGTATITVQLSSASGVDVAVPFTVNSSSTATGGGVDYSITASPVTIPAGNTSADITVNIVSDSLNEDSETVIVNMGTPTNATQGAITTHTLTITDDDPMPSVTFTSASQSTVGESGTATITAQLSAASGKNVTVPFTVNASSTATGGGVDYSITASPITIPAGSTTANITVSITPDTLNEDNETVIVDMGTPTNATKGATTTHTLTITDDDPLPTVAFATASQSKSESGGTATITVQLSAASSKVVTVPFTVNSSSTATGGGVDYSITASPITIPAGSTSANITVTITNDSLVEGNETVIVDMGAPTNATKGAVTSHTLTIMDDDGSVTINVCGNLSAPFNKIQTTIADAGTVNGSTLLVCAGTYSENINFLGKAITVKSASGAASTIIQGATASTNAPVATFSTGETSSSVLDGFTIDNQNNAGSASRGIYINGAAPTIKNSIIQGNSATNCTENSSACGGAGVYIVGSSPFIDNCKIRANTATNRNGAGMYITGAASGATITNSTIGGSTSSDGNSGGNSTAGAGIYFTGSTTGILSISGSYIQNNIASAKGGGLSLSNITNPTIISSTTISANQTNAQAAGIYSLNSPLTITNSHIDNNTALHYGGGLYLDGASANATINGGSISGNTCTSTSDGNGPGIYMTGGAGLSYTGGSIIGNTAGANIGGGIYDVDSGTTLTLTKMYIQGNKVKQHGAGIYLVSGSTATITNSVITGNDGGTSNWEMGGGIYTNGTLNVNNSTIAGNYAGKGGAIYVAGGSATVTNSIIWGNTAGDGSNGISGTATVTYSDIQGGYSGTGNINSDPLFVNLQQASSGNPTSAGNYHICYASGSPAGCTSGPSPCIDTGNTYTGVPSDDIDGNTRPYDVSGIGDGVNDYDMGADEYVP